MIALPTDIPGFWPLLAGTGTLVAVLIFMRAVRTAPDGYEDEAGFHFTTEAKPERRKEAASLKALRTTSSPMPGAPVHPRSSPIA